MCTDVIREVLAAFSMVNPFTGEHCLADCYGYAGCQIHGGTLNTVTVGNDRSLIHSRKMCDILTI